MKYFQFILFLSLISQGYAQEVLNPKVKSITKTIDGDLLERKEFDINGTLVFEKHDQIDFGKDNSIIFITAYEYDTINNLVYKYHANSNSSLDFTIDSLDINSSLRKRKMGIYNDIGNRKKYRNNLFKINSKPEFIKYFKSVYPKKHPFITNYEYSDTIITKIVHSLKNDTVIIETKKSQDGLTLEYSKAFYDKENREFKEIKTQKYNRTVEIIYNENGRILRQNETGQHYQFYYQDDLLIKREMYHRDLLAFTVEYFYENKLLVREIKYRITESKYFLNVPKVQTVLYHYDYY